MGESGASFLRIIDGRPRVVVDGQNLTAFYSETFPQGMHKRNRQMAEAGVQVFMLLVRGGYEDDFVTTWFWRDDGVYADESDRTDGLSLGDQAEEILDADPNAWLMVRWGSEVPKRWAERHPDQLQAGEEGRRRESSYASRLAAEGRAEMARRILRCVEAFPWRDRVIGYMPFGQDEGTHNLALNDALFDLSPVMLQEFRSFLEAKYQTDEALRSAWQAPKVTLAAATVPTDSEWQAQRGQWMHWPEPRELQRYQDYFLAMRLMLMMQRQTELAAVKEATQLPIFTGTDALKQPMLGWLHNDAFDAKAFGMPWRNVLLASGSIDVGPMLDLPELDTLITPADYTARSVGFGWEPEGIGDSLVLRGKTILVEDDARSWATVERETQGAWRTVEECRVGLLRNLALAASRGHIPYWMNVGGGYFDDPEVLKVVADQIPVREKLLTLPHGHTEHAIAMIIDDESPLDEDFTTGFQHLAVLHQRTDHLALTGLPYRVYLLSDVERNDFPRFRAYLFPNLFRLTPARIALIRDKLMRDGSVLIFGPGTGISNGSELTAEPASELLGFPLELVHKESARRVLAYGGSHLALASVAGSEVYGDSYVYGPLLQPAGDLAGSGAVELGKVSAWWQCNRAGLVLKEFGEGAAGNGKAGARTADSCAVVFSMATPISAAVLRSLARYAGCNPWSDLGDVVAASANLVAVHSTRPGRRTIRLPEPAAVTDAVSGRRLAENAAEFDIALKSPDTQVFALGRSAIV